MGEMADLAIERAFAEAEHYEKYKYSNHATQYEEGLIDEYGATIGNPRFIGVRTKEWGYGPCPKCGADTVKINGKFGPFWGCSKFPGCKGSRNG